MENLKEKLTRIAKQEMDYATENGSSTLSTCDYRGWDKDVWNNRQLIIKKLRDCGYNVSVKVAWGVTDIVTTKKIEL
jgi:hypothetical protein